MRITLGFGFVLSFLLGFVGLSAQAEECETRSAVVRGKAYNVQIYEGEDSFYTCSYQLSYELYEPVEPCGLEFSSAQAATLWSDSCELMPGDRASGVLRSRQGSFWLEKN